MKSSRQYRWTDGYLHFKPEYPGQPEYVPERDRKQAKAKAGAMTLLDSNAVMALADDALVAAPATRQHADKKALALRDQRAAELTPKLGPALARFAAGLTIKR